MGDICPVSLEFSCAMSNVLIGIYSGIFFDYRAYHVFRIGLVGVIALCPVFDMIGSCVLSSGFSAFFVS